MSDFTKFDRGDKDIVTISLRTRTKETGRHTYLSVMTVLLGLMLTLIATGCGDSSNDRSTDLYVIHVTPNVGPITVYFDNQKVVDGLEYADVSKRLTIDVDDRVRVRVLAEGVPAPVYDQSRSFRDDRDYMMIVSRPNNSRESNDVRVTYEATNNRGLVNGTFAIRFANYSRSVTSADAYLTYPGTALRSVQPTNSRISSNQLSSFTEVERDEYEVSFTEEGSNTSLLSFGGIEYRQEREYTVFLVEDELRDYDFGAIVVDFPSRGG